MSESVVYHCDWCGAEVPPKNDAGPLTGRFAMAIRAEQRFPFPPIGEKPKHYDICAMCAKAFAALTEGKYRR